MRSYHFYRAVAMQPERWNVKDRLEMRERLEGYFIPQIDAAVRFAGHEFRPGKQNWAPVKLLCYQEFAFQGFDASMSLEDFLSVAVPIPGEETDLLARKAAQYDIYIGGGFLEVDPDWPGRFFNTYILVGPNGEVVLKYRKNFPLTYVELATAPTDIYDQYVERYGAGARTFYPVADTPIGKIGALICNDGGFPEAARALAFNGAEVVIHSNWMQPYTDPPKDLWEVTNRVRAAENMCYVVAPTAAVIHARYAMKGGVGGHAMIVDPEGVVLAMADHPIENMVSAVINLDTLRAMRSHPMANCLTTLRTESFRDIYAKSVFPPNRFLDRSPQTPLERTAIQEEVIESFYEAGTFVRPEVLAYEPEHEPPPGPDHA